ncbi:MAG: Crp/Fnr family transcriptional regulator [Pseudaminobacter sp.]|nr:Crp/Fnr family transcriptional regulator [Pseudaminobacter sp.]
MFNSQNHHYKNSLLRKMSADDLRLIEPHLERCLLPLKMPLEGFKTPIDFIYFFEAGIGSIVAGIPKGRETEVGLIGFEGMTGSAIVLGDHRATHDCYIQLAGQGFRMPVEALSEALSKSPTLRLFLLRFVHSLFTQTGYTALVNARSKLEDRLARWLLMCDDRVEGDRLTITHESLAIMLGVRRPGVTVAIQILEGKGLIRASRGEILIRDHEGLIALADGGYGEPEAEYQRLVGKID